MTVVAVFIAAVVAVGVWLSLVDAVTAVMAIYC